MISMVVCETILDGLVYNEYVTSQAISDLPQRLEWKRKQHVMK